MRVRRESQGNSTPSTDRGQTQYPRYWVHRVHRNPEGRGVRWGGCKRESQVVGRGGCWVLFSTERTPTSCIRTLDRNDWCACAEGLVVDCRPEATNTFSRNPVTCAKPRNAGELVLWMWIGGLQGVRTRLRMYRGVVSSYYNEVCTTSWSLRRVRVHRRSATFRPPRRQT